MAVSSNINFNLKIAQIIEEALQYVGGEPNLGSELQDGMRTLNLLAIDLQNRGIFLHTLEEVVLDVVADTGSYILENDTLDVHSIVLRRGSIDVPLERMGFDAWNRLSPKSQSGSRITRVFIDRQRDAPVLYVWPIPDNSDDDIVYWKTRYITDTDTPSNTIDFPRRYHTAVVLGMAHLLSLKRGIDEATSNRANYLNSLYERALLSAQREDRERVNQRFLPRYEHGSG